MHTQALAFVAKHAPKETADLRVLEIGSYDVNGSVRPLFPGAQYVGLDRRKGRGVDVVADGATWEGDGEPFDLIVSTETLEHAPDPGAVLRNARRLLRPGGTLILTAAAPERAPHGQDGQHGLPKGEHYANIDPDWLKDALSNGWEVEAFEHHPKLGDVYAVARKAGRANSPAKAPEKPQERRSAREAKDAT